MTAQDARDPGQDPERPSTEHTDSAVAGDTEQAHDHPTDEVIDEPELSLTGAVGDAEPRLSHGRALDQTRAHLTWAFTAIFAGTIAVVFAMLAWSSATRSAEAITLLKTLLPAETAILGSAVGFYFGARSR